MMPEIIKSWISNYLAPALKETLMKAVHKNLAELFVFVAVEWNHILLSVCINISGTSLPMHVTFVI
jgi:hypothetical protein